MGSEYKRIILLKGLELINDYQFSIVKSLLAHDLGLTSNMQEEYNKVKIADLMEKKFPGAACVDKLIDLFKDMPPLKDIVKQLRNEKMKVAKKMKTTEETPKKKPQQARVGPTAFATTASSAQLCERAEGTTASQCRFAKCRHSGHLLRARQKRGKRFRDLNTLTSPPLYRRVRSQAGNATRAPWRTPIFRRLELFPSQRRGGSSRGLSASVNISPRGLSALPPLTHCPPLGDSRGHPGVSQDATFPKRKPVAKGTAAAKKNKGFQPQTLPACHSGASTAAALGFLPPPQTSSSAPSVSAFPEVPLPVHPLPGFVAPGDRPCCPSQASQLPGAKGLPLLRMVKGQHQAAPRGRVFQQGPLTVLVLKATEPFEYKSAEEGRSGMFHATVATPSQFFHVKVLNSNLKEKFTKENIITILDYYECKGILEINKTSSVYEANPFQSIVVPNSIIKRANETPKIDNLYKQASGTFVYGLFLLHEKKVNRKTTVYEIQDNTGIMEVLGTERWHNIKCDKGDKLRLFCFQLKTIDQKLKLTCGTHSFIQVIKARKSKKEPVGFDLKVEFDMMHSPPDHFMGFHSDLVKTEDFY
ncbi:PREDICTED: myeloid cell nuclear differentiation antigen [Odobenus rosmarus divergens]|uniref:Myeloid cell nuclear differentiation antigen n=1 Tax=Odobenus rosmarus divergens TaxID=9708 RepID=A0A2U3X127_ODORO|nr:PREDICTED: myeloid cell nuclear differentiation antigen [Odobenus rosmarus divergens]